MKTLSIKIFVIFFTSILLLSINFKTVKAAEITIDDSINPNLIIKESIEQIKSKSLSDYEKYFEPNSMVEFTSVVKNTLTVKFNDGKYKLIFENNGFTSSNNLKLNTNFDKTLGKTALILNPCEYLYGNLHCKKIINNLIKDGYNINYLSDEDVNLNFTKNCLAEEIVYFNTHAGYWDTNGDGIEDAVVIATGELWSDNTEDIYEFEYENEMIVEGFVGNNSFVCFTPLFIKYYYENNKFSDSLIYMATCHATYDDSMANAFLESGAEVFIGWSGNTLFWTNSLTSSLAFKMLTLGFNVKQVCKIIRFGGIYNRILGAKLIYFGDGDYAI